MENKENSINVTPEIKTFIQEEAKKLMKNRYDAWYRKGNNRAKRLDYYKKYYQQRKMENVLNGR